MATTPNTVKALSEDRKAKIASLRDLSNQLTAKPADAELLKRYQSADDELKSLDENIARVRRIEELETSTRDAGTQDLFGTEDKTLTPQQRKDDPLIDTDAKGYRVLDIIEAKLENRALTGIASEVQQRMEELAQKDNRKCRGIMLPMNLRCDLPAARRFAGSNGAENRDLTVSTGSGAIQTNVAPTLITLLRNRVVVQRLGATILSGMVGNFSLPKETAQPTFAWVAEGAGTTKSNGTIGQVAFGPKTLTAWSVLSRRFTKQTSIDAEMFARYQLIEGAARGVDFGALSGPGTTDNVTGIMADTNVPLVAIGTNGGNLTWAKAVEFETKVATNNADVDTMAYVVNAVTNGSTKTLPKIADYPVFLQENKQINGYQVAVTNQLPANLSKGSASGTLSSMCFGDFSKLFIAFWGGLDLLVDPYSEGTTGNVRVISFQDADINRTYAEAFSRCVDVLP